MLERAASTSDLGLQAEQLYIDCKRLIDWFRGERRSERCTIRLLLESDEPYEEKSRRSPAWQRRLEISVQSEQG